MKKVKPVVNVVEKINTNLSEVKISEVEMVSPEEMAKIRDARAKAVYATTLAEKSYSQAQVAELEAKNLILTVFNKYGLDVTKDNVQEDGTIIRHKAV
jgi:hypothetical protein